MQTNPELCCFARSKPIISPGYEPVKLTLAAVGEREPIAEALHQKSPEKIPCDSLRAQIWIDRGAFGYKRAVTTYAAVIFDMDGVIADSEPVYLKAMNAVLTPLGKAVTPELHLKAMGHGVEETWRLLAEALDLGPNRDDLVREYDAYLCKALAQVHETLPGVRELIDALRSRRVRLGLASSSWPGWIEALLRGTGLTGCFDVIVSRIEVPRGKPAPDVYLAAAERLGVEPERCIAVEDTPTGLAAAHAAGMLAVQVRSSSTAFPPQPSAQIVLDTLLDFDLRLVIVS